MDPTAVRNKRAPKLKAAHAPIAVLTELHTVADFRVPRTSWGAGLATGQPMPLSRTCGL